MWVGLSKEGSLAAQHWIWLGVTSCLAGAVWLLWCKTRLQKRERRRDVRAHEELQAYAQLDAGLPVDGDPSELARWVCRLVAEKSAFQRAALLLRDAEENLYVAANIGMDDQTVTALRAWSEHMVVAERSGKPGSRRGDGGLGMRVGKKSFAVVLGKEPTAVGFGRAIVVPLWTTGGRMVGALVVCANGLMSVQRSVVAEATTALEALAMKLGRSIENTALAERLLRAEKLAGLGLLAGGVAHALNNPLTAVLGFAELIAHTTTETRVQADAETIVREARRMRQTVQTLLNVWRPMTLDEEEVEVPALLRELAGACSEKLENRGVRLVVQAGDDVPAIRGNRERLRQVMEHLLNNAAQAVGAAQALGVESPLAEDGGGQHSIRVTVSHDERALHLIVSDTGPGFREPGRMFDPFYTTLQPGGGAGMGLSLCYGIVREHGGEISAFNLHPHGAAVLVDLPRIGVKAERNFENVAREVA
jgi:signal transduction histidine kinase